MTENRCQWGVTGYVGPNWVGIQCSRNDGHVHFSKDDKLFDHGNPSIGTFWNETDENAQSPDQPMVNPNTLPSVPDKEVDPEPGPTECFVIMVPYEEIILAVAMNKAKRDEFLRVYNMNRIESDHATYILTDVIP